MTFAITWHPAAVTQLQRLHWQTAARLDAAVQAFATTGEGRIDRIEGRPLLRRLYVGTSRMVLQVDVVERRLLVLALFV